MNSWKIQNEVIACIAEGVRRHIRYILENANPANKLRNKYVFFRHFLVTNERKKILHNGEQKQNVIVTYFHT